MRLYTFDVPGMNKYEFYYIVYFLFQYDYYVAVVNGSEPNPSLHDVERSERALKRINSILDKIRLRYGDPSANALLRAFHNCNLGSETNDANGIKEYNKARQYLFTELSKTL